MLIIPSFSNARVLVVGDVMLDRYWHGDTARISPEAPVPVVRIGAEELRLGGAANVALNLAVLGVKTTLLGVIGNDEPGRLLHEKLEAAGIDAPLLRSANHPTIAKLRVISRNQQLIRLDFEESFDAEAAFDGEALYTGFAAALADADVVVFSDYAKGTLTDVGRLITCARDAGVLVLVDPKGKDWSRYRGANVITPNLAELAAVVGDVADELNLERKAQTLRTELRLEGLLITRSERGMSLFQADQSSHFPAQTQEVFDVTGAGDTVIATLAAGLATGLAMADAAMLANLAAGVVVAKLGTATVTVEELRRAVRSRRQDARGVLNEQELLAHVNEARVHGEKIVMTNGCFDLLHPGHIQYLEAARALGDWLIVAVNDDASVRRLKGVTRPINPLQQRMQVLQGLAAVDWVLPFTEDTPQRVIEQVKPDVLVKGGDYKVADVAGGQSVLAAGGDVRILEFVEGYSTSDMVTRIQSNKPAD